MKFKWDFASDMVSEGVEGLVAALTAAVLLEGVSMCALSAHW